MAKIKIITDSSSDIPGEVSRHLNISTVPIKIEFEGKSYTDRVTLDTEEFYSRFEQSESIATTSQPSPADFHSTFVQAVQDGYTQLLSVHLSSTLSGTYQSALIARGMLLEEYPDIELQVLDTKTASYATGIAVVAAAKLLQESEQTTLEDCIKIIEEYTKKSKLFVIPATLKYLERSGRISKASAMVGTLLNIVPILSVTDDGKIGVVDKVRGSKKAMRRIKELLQQSLTPGSPISLAVLHANNYEGAQQLFSILSEDQNIVDSLIVPIGPAVGVHTGPGLLAAVALSV